MTNSDERQRIAGTAIPPVSVSHGEIQKLTANCSGNADAVLQRVREVLLDVIDETRGGSIDLNPSTIELPSWFLDGLVPPESRGADMRAISRSDRDARRDCWTLESWLYWFRDDRREWRWWSATVRDQNTFEVALWVDDVPFLWGALEFLMRSAGAKRCRWN